jgi:hypothetical protein
MINYTFPVRRLGVHGLADMNDTIQSIGGEGWPPLIAAQALPAVWPADSRQRIQSITLASIRAEGRSRLTHAQPLPPL